MIDALMAKCRRECRDYFEINWRQTRIAPGYSILEKKLTPAQKPLVDVPKKIRVPASTLIKAPRMVISREDIAPYMVTE